MLKYYLPAGFFLASALFFGTLSSLSSQVVINEYSVSNLATIQDNYLEYEDWIELYNAGTEMIHLEGYYLSDNPAEPLKWQVPSGVNISPGNVILFWASGRDVVSQGHRHTNFRLKQTQEVPDFIILSDPAGTIIDQLQLGITQKDHSRGRITDGDGSWGIFTVPTPGYSNNTATPYLAYTEKPAMSISGGFFSSPFAVNITTNEPDAVVRYTMDGTEPVESSEQYTVPLDIQSTTVIKARVFSTDPLILPGLIEFNTYLFHVTTSLPVLSVAGNDLLELLNGDASLRPWGSIEFFNKTKERTTTAYGEFNEHGQDSWVHPQRSIDYITRDECGYAYALHEKFFALSDRDEFQRVILRAAGDDNYPGIDTSAHIRDDFVQTLSQKAGQHLDWRKSERCILFANGVYWGIYAIREKVHDHDYTDYYYQQGKFDLQFIMLWGSTWAEYGGYKALQDWYELHDFIMGHDMADPEIYQTVTDQYDITSLVDYMLINSYVVCSDWLNWNVGWWRGLNPEGSHRKWAYILWDEDATFGHYINYTGVPGQNPYVPPCYQEGLTDPWQDPEGHVALLNQLRNNPEFDQYYISRYIDLINTSFNDAFMLPLLDSMAMIIHPEIEYHVDRWGGSQAKWSSNIARIKNFIITRNSILSDSLMTCYSLTGPYDIVLNVEPAGSGMIGINSLEPKQYPWHGNYYGNIDVKLSAIENNPRYEFDHWELGNHQVSPSDTVTEVTLSLTATDSLIAHFRSREFLDSLVINEINYNSAGNFNPGDWVEFYNPHPYSLDVSGWFFRDSDDEHTFLFPEGLVMEPDGYLVLCDDTAAFHSLFPDVENYMGNMDFGLNNTGELIRLYNSEGVPVDTVLFDDQEPWPEGPDGDEPTLELINPAWDNALAESWAASADHGTPGAMNSVFVGVQPLPMAETLSCRIFPNPFNDHATITLVSEMIPDGLSLVVYNLFGNQVKRIEKISTTQIQISKDNLPAGFYFYQVFNANHKVLYTGKFIIS